ncbi:ATP-binding protein [Actinophytocola sediminis]
MLIGMLGPFEVRADDGTTVDVPGARLRALLVALALDAGRVVPKATLVDWIWGEHPPADAANALQRLASRLRKALPGGLVDGHPNGYRLVVDPDVVDAVRFERLVGQARDADGPARVALLREAGALWRGDAMREVGLPDSAAFAAAATRLDELRLTALEDRFAAEAAPGHEVALAELTDLVTAHPTRERLVTALMRALVAAGRDTEALRVYQRTRDALADALGVDPSPELSALHVALLRGEVARPATDRQTNLRAELTSFVGKDADLAAVRDLVTQHRLSTLIGPGGAGKTRLATETARTMVDDLPDGVWLVELAAIGADGDVAQATLGALGVRDALLGDTSNLEPTDRLIAAIRERDAVLILDNCEHVIESAATFAHRLLGECRRLRILATSREPLGITGEALWPVVPLGLPGGDADAGEIESSPAVRLLWDRASAVRTDLRVDADTLATMARVCRALDGMPLAIELAAARLRTMSIDQLASRLADRFRLLTGGSRTALPRHRTLRAMVDWSWELLTDAERVVLRRLSVFAGGAGLEAAEHVCAGDAGERERVLELLTALTEKSLLVAGGAGAPRYRMLGTIKEYADQRLAEAGETELARRAHLAYFTEFTEAVEPRLRRGEQLVWLAALKVEHDNIGAAMRGALAAGDAPAAMRLAMGAAWYWWLSGRKAEGMELLTAATETPGEVPDEVRATVYGLISMFVNSAPVDVHAARKWIHEAYRLGRHHQHFHPALRLAVPLERMLWDPEEIVPAWESLLADEEPWVRAISALHLGKILIGLGRGGYEVDAYLETALAGFQAIGERFGIAFALSELADRIAMRGEFARACEYYEQAVAVVTEIGAVDDVIQQRSRQVRVYWLLGDQDAAETALAEAQRYAERDTWPGTLAQLAITRAKLANLRGDATEVSEQLDVATALLGDEAGRPHVRWLTHQLRAGVAEDLDEARAHRVAAYRAATETDDASIIAEAIVGIADLAARQGEYEQAARLLGASTGVRGLLDHANPDLARIGRTARSRLGEPLFAEAAGAGSETSWRELVEVTLAS